MTEIADFAAALRQMADNADRLSERHDVAGMAQLRQQVEEQATQAQRDADLIDELRRQLATCAMRLDAIGTLRKNVLTGARPFDVVQILGDALLILAGSCASYTGPSSCRDDPGRTRVAEYAADSWCESCVARDALERAGIEVAP